MRCPCSPTERRGAEMTYTFESCFAARIEDFIAQKNALGFGYLESSRLLRDFDRFCMTHFPEENFLTEELCLAWATHPSKSSFGKLPRNDLVRRQWYSCPATASRNGDSSERSSEGCKTREQRQLPFSRCLCSGKKRRTGASIKISKAGAALHFTGRPRG